MSEAAGFAKGRGRGERQRQYPGVLNHLVLGWACFWFIAGFFTFLLGLVFVPCSLSAILIPIGAEPRQKNWYSISPKLPPPGWYQDPDPARPLEQHYWDGAAWR
jgi:hypothetical protein